MNEKNRPMEDLDQKLNRILTAINGTEPEDRLPDMKPLNEFAADPPRQPEELIRGVLRRGHKMLISGSSKAGKSFLLMELCIAIAEGNKWLGFPCRQGKVLYVNLEIDPASCVDRFLKIYEALGIVPKHMDNIIIWNLRGHAVPLNLLTPKLISRVREDPPDAVIIDPIYKVITGDENNASDMAAFCNQFDRICAETGSSVIYCHHHSKGAQGAKRAMDRASGSGVFARDPDAQLDMIELELTEEIRNFVAERGASAWRMECSLREFPNFKPFDFWFEYPVHRPDRGRYLKNMPAQGTPEANLNRRNINRTDAAEKAFRTAYEAVNLERTGVTVKDMAAYLGLAERSVRDRVYKMKSEFRLKNGRVFRTE